MDEIKDTPALSTGNGASPARRAATSGRPSSFAQERLWLLDRIEPDGSFNVISAAVRLTGSLDVETLGRSLDQIMQRHEVLRTFFKEHEGGPVQSVAPAMTLPLRVLDLTASAPAQREVELQRLLSEETQRPFDLSTGPLVRATLLKLEEEKQVLLLCMHENVSDPESVTIFMTELAALYAAGVAGRPSPLPELPIQYADFALWQRERFSGAALEEHLAYWHRQLQGELPVLELPTDRARPPVQTFRGAQCRLDLAPSLGETLEAFSRHRGVPLFTTLLAAFVIQLRRYTSQDEILIGTLANGRAREETRGLIGHLVNPLVIRADVSGNPTFTEFLLRLGETVSQAAAHQELPFEKLLEELQPERDRSRPPLFQALCTMRDASQETAAWPGVAVAAVELERRTTKFDLSLIWTKGERLTAALEYNTDLFEAATISRMAKHSETLLRGILSNPEQHVLELPLLTTAEERQLLVEWNNTRADYPEQTCLHELFEARVEASPEGVAVISEEEQLTYSQLNRRANQVGRWLRARGVGPGGVVGICMERGVEMVVGLLGIAKAGAAYLPLDPTYPPERLAFMLEDAQAAVLLTQQRLTHRLAQQRAEVVCIDSQWQSIAQGGEENLRSGVTPEDLVYVIYTSGSTGRPKGVMLDHRGRVNNFSDFNRRFGVAAGDRLLALSSLSFDMCAYDVFGTLAAGATIVLPSAARTLDPAHWAALIARHQVTLWHSVPAMLEMLVEYAEARPDLRPRSLRLALLGGDWIPVRLPDRVKALAEGVRVISLGGATEVSMDSTIYSIETSDPTWRSIPYGVPMANQLAYVLDERLRLLPAGVPGELHLGGLGLAWGYFNRPGLTAEKFIPHPFSGRPGGRLYKTGDLARYGPDGNLELLGRIDFQVKVRGFRVELGEIAAALRQHPSVEEAVVVARADEQGQKRLAAYVVPHQENASAVRRLMRLEKEAASNNLPRYELPDGTPILHLNKGETDFLYQEIFEERSYLRHGITLDEGACVFDVGANIGLFSLFIRRVCRSAEIYAFEPIPAAFRVLQANAAVHGLKAKLFECGVSDQDKSAAFTFYPHFTIGSSRFADPLEARAVIKAFITGGQKEDGGEPTDLSETLMDELLDERLKSQQVICQLKTISNVIRENGVGRIDLLKVDAEKSELEVLAGIDEPDWLKIRQVVMEVHGRERLEQAVPLLERHGYVLTIEQGGSLKETTNYNIYASRPAEAGGANREPARTPDVEPVAHPGSPQQLTADLRTFLKERLPEYMLPAAFVLLEALPLTPNGKVDRRALPEPEVTRAELQTPYAAPRTPVEEVLAGIWAGLLGVEQIGVNDDFFTLGGHSLLATQLISRVRGILHVELSLRHIFDTPILAELASKIEAAQREEQGRQAPPILPVPRDGELPTSYAQQRLWFLDKLVPDSAVYNIPAAIRLTGQLDPEALERSLNELLKRHETLRTSIAVVDEKPVQIIAPALSLGVPSVDLSGSPEAERELAVKRFIAEEAARPFDLSTVPLLRAKLLRLSGREHVLLLTMHHVISDGWSMGIFVRELAALYASTTTGEAPSLAELPIQYADFAHWQREWLQGDTLETQLAYWRRRLDGASVLEVPTDRPRPPIPSHRGATQTFLLPKSLSENLKELSRREGATLYMILLATFQTLLHRYSGQEDIVVGTPIANRNHAEVEGLIGFFVNMLVMRGRLSGGMEFRGLLAQVREAALEAYAHQDVPFERLVEELQSERDLSRHPLFQVAFALQNAPVSKVELPGLSLEMLPVEEYTAKFDLTLLMEETDEGLFGSFTYSADLFDDATASRMLRHLQKMLEAVADNPNRRLAELPMLTEPERHQLLYEFNDNATEYQRELCVHQLFEAQVELTPEAVALVYEDGQLSYAELNERANRLADYLRPRLPAPEPLVALLLDRSPDLIVSLLAALKAGAAYLPLDPSDPPARLRSVLRDARPAILLTDSRPLEDILPDDDAPRLLRLDREWPPLAPSFSPRDARSASDPDSLAYLIYTSGSTGAPKGIAVTHRGVARLVKSASYASFSSGEVFLQFAPVSFDASTFEVWGALLNGARLALMPPGRPSLEELGRFIRERGVTTLWLTAGLFHLMVEERVEDLRGLRQLLAGGDVLSPRHVARALAELPHCRLINGYGPTENTTFTCCHTVAAGEAAAMGAVPIGRAVSNTRVYVLDAGMGAVPAGVAGELYAGGEGLARGYYGDAGRTAERFVPDLHSGEAGARLYRTGDVVRRGAGGALEFIGRRDQQVKVRGFRIELGEVEAALGRHAGVREAAVVARKGEGGDRRLVAYVVAARGGTTPDAGELRAHMRRALPEYMVPSAFVTLDELPLSPNGKVDRKALPAPQGGDAPGHVYVAPRTPTEEMLAGIWATVLGLEKVGVEDNFFEVGGHSLLATQVVSRVRRVFGVEMGVRMVFERATVEGQAEWVERETRGGATAVMAPAMARVSREGALPLSFAQQRLWFLSQLEPDNPFYNVPLAIRLSGRLDVAALERAFAEITRRHEALRTRFANDGGQPVQLISPPPAFKLRPARLEHLAERERESEVERLSRAEARRPFDLSTGPLLRAKLLRLSEWEHVLLLTMHHIVSDGWSMGVLVREVAALYGAYAEGRESPLPELEVQYADYASWQRGWLGGGVLEGQVGYWRRQLAGVSGVLELPADRPRPPVQSFRGSTYSFVLPASLSAELDKLNRQEGVSLFMTLLAAWQTLLSRYSGQHDIVVGTPIANRNRAETEELIGCFLNTLAIRSDLSGNPPFRELLRRVKETSLAAFANQDVPFEMLVEELQPERKLDHTPLFQVMLTLHNTPVPSMEFAGLTLDLRAVETETSKLDLVLNITEEERGLVGLVEYNTDLFEATTIESMMRQFHILLASVAAHPERALTEQALLTEAEERRLLVDWNDTRKDYPPPRCVHQLFEAQVSSSPEATAAVFEGEQLSYRELNARANQLAHFLRQQGVGSGDCIGLFLEHSFETLIAVLGVLKAGAAYVPLDPEHPKSRVAFVLKDAAVTVLLTQRRLSEMLPAGDARVVCLDTDWEAIAGQSEQNPPAAVKPSDLAYVIYTSGSTGEPKGVKIEHGALFNYIRWASEVYLQGESAAFALYSSPAFDLTVTSIYAPLVTGNKVIVYRKEGGETPLFKIIQDDEVGVLKLTPSHLMLIKDRDNRRSRIKRLIVGGEALPTGLARQVHASFGGRVEIYNEYGPTEATVGCMLHRFDPERDERAGVPIGRPAANVQIYVLNEALRPAGENVVGELYISGEGLAQGYLNRDELTRARFVANPFVVGERMYRSGDLARHLTGGAVEYLGRRDEQVKFHGYRVELNEIRGALNRHPQITDSVVTVLRDETGNDLLVAYYVSTQKLDGADLREWLSESIIEETIPNIFAPLPELPLTINGKIDYAALPRLDDIRQKAGSNSDVARTPVEELLAGIWAEVLGVEASRIAMADNFFALGGHSLLAILVVSRVREVFRIELPVRSLFQAPTVAALAAKVESYLREGTKVEEPPMARVSREGALPLSFAQQRLWFLSQLEPDNPFYNVPLAIRLSGRLDVAALERAFAEITRRHEALRTRFANDGGQPVQLISPPPAFKLRPARLEHLAERERESEVERLSRAEARRPFDLSTGPLLRAKLLRLSEREHVLLLTMHHIVSDGWSMGVLVREVAALYGAYAEGRESPLAELGVQYADYASWQRGWLGGGVLEGQVGYWRRQLAGVSGVLELPADRPRPPVQSFRGSIISFEFSPELTKNLKALSQQLGATLFMTLLAAFNVLMCRYTGDEDILIASPTANRNRPEIEGLIGFFVNALLMRGDLSGNPTFEELLARVRETALEAYSNQDVPFERLVEELQPARDMSRHPLFQVIFSLQDASLDRLALPGLKLKIVPIDNQTSMFDLTLLMEERGESLGGIAQYNTDLFDALTIERMIVSFQSLLEGIVINPQQHISALPLMNSEEQRQRLTEWSDTATDYERQYSIPEIFEAQVAQTPDNIALVLDEQQISYAELNERANRLADYLRPRLPAPEPLVALLLDRSPDLIVSLLAALKAGAAYLPLDPSDPPARLRSVLRDARPAILLTDSRPLEDILPPDDAPRLLRLDREWPPLSHSFSPRDARSASDPDSLAYLIYTSGSTGAPKGIAVTHRGVARLVKSASYASFSSGEVFLQFAPVSFDASTFEVWGALLNGARLALMPPGRPSLEELGRFIRERGVTTLWLTAGLFHLMVEERVEDLRGLRQLLAGGDVLSPRHVARALAELPHCRLINGYGPTENTTFTCCHTVAAVEAAAMGAVPIGRAVSNTRVYVLDAGMGAVPAGVAGELYAGGEGLARGYYGDAGRTAERFVPDPHSGEAGARLYRTGDVVRRGAGGALEFIGRRDQQVKVRGFRIELGEVEAALCSHEGVRLCAVVARPAPGGTGAERRLVAYVEAGGAGATAGELREHLRGLLPEYMQPATYVFVGEMPLTGSGKVDRGSLPEVAWETGSEAGDRAGHVGPRTPVEELLAGIWGEVLGVEVGEIGVRDNFFEVGGHSLLATQVVSRVRRVFGVEMGVRVVFERATVEGQAEWVEREMRGGATAVMAPPMVRVSREGALPLSFAQQRLWFLDQLTPGSTAYNICTNVPFKGALNLAALERSVNEIVRRHEILRTTLVAVEGKPVQHIAPAADFALPVINLEGDTASGRTEHARRVIHDEASRPFDLARGPLLRVKLLRFEEEEHVLLFSMHHVITDGWSEGVLFDELRALYAAFSAGEPSPLPELAIQYADFAVWQRGWLSGSVLEAQLAYWKRQLAGAPSMLELPTDRPRPAVQGYQGARQSCLLSEELTEGLKALCQREGVTLFMTLLAGFQTLLSRYSGQEDIVIGSPVAGRNRSEVEGLIGFFINTLVLRGDLTGDPTFKELLRRVKEVALEAYEHQDVPFAKLVDELHLERDLGRTPLFQVFFNLLNLSGDLRNSLPEELELQAATGTTVPAPETTKFDLTLYALSHGPRLRLDLVYNTELFEASTITKMFGHFQTLLGAVLANTEQRLSTLPLITEAARQQLLARENLVRPETAFTEFKKEAAEQTIVARFAEQVKLHPENIAVKSRVNEWSYRTLDRMSTQVARAIQRLPERICLLFEHDAPMILGLLAALKAGKTYVPLDPQYPQERLSFILKDAQAGAILTNNANLAAAQKLAGAAQVINLDALGEAAPREDAPPRVAPDAMAYILYTSGSAGQPKGVMQSHRNVLHHIRNYTNNLHLGPGDRLTLLSSYSFDAAVMDIYGALLNGATLCPFNLKDEGLEPFPAWLTEQEITVYHSTPTVYRYFLNGLGGGEDFSRIRLVVLGGEEVFRRDVELYRKHFPSECIFINGLGPTESTVTLQYMMGKGSHLTGNRVPVGYPVEGTEVLLLNDHHEGVAAHSVGEIAIRSDHVALGYWQRPNLTRKAFLQDADGGGRRTYYTGDLGRLLPDGGIEFIGRRDFQVKIRGYKIDFSEIETCLRARPGVKEALVNASDAVPADRRLVAYLVCDAGAPPDLEELRRALSEQLPDYMMPSAFVTLDALPLTPTGKLDRLALPEPDWNSAPGDDGAERARTPVEETLAGIWGEVLGLEAAQFGVEDNFFQRGGHSLLATLVISRMREAFRIGFPLRTIFHSPTIAGLAEAVLESLIEQEESEQVERLLNEMEQLPTA